MEVQNKDEFEKYIRENYKLILTNNSSAISEDFAGFCDTCDKDVFLRIGSRWKTHVFGVDNYPFFVTFFIQCPKCKKQSFIESVVLAKPTTVGGRTTYDYEHYKLLQLPTQDVTFETQDIPEEYILLKKTVTEAKYNLLNSQYMSAAMMYRRALQILAKQILGAKGRTLFDQLKWLQENENNLKINLTELFHDNSKLIREVGNQSAHPEDDEDLHEFNEADANALHDLFLLLVNDVFVLPEKIKAMKVELANRRKLK